MPRVLDIVIAARNELGKGLSSANTSIKRWSDGIKSNLGRGSALDEIGDIMQGRGAVKGFTQILDVVADTTGAIRQALTDIRTGAKPAGEAIADAAKNIPFFGQGVRIGADIREMITGTEAAQLKLNRALERQVLLSEGALRAAKAFKKEMDELRDNGRGLFNQASLGGLSGFDLQRAQAAQARDRELRDIQKAAREAREKAGSPADRRRVDLEEAAQKQNAESVFRRVLQAIGSEQLKAVADYFNSANARRTAIEAAKKEAFFAKESVALARRNAIVGMAQGIIGATPRDFTRSSGTFDAGGEITSRFGGLGAAEKSQAILDTARQTRDANTTLKKMEATLFRLFQSVDNMKRVFDGLGLAGL